MSRIDELIEQFCPEGVEFAVLGEVVRIRNGKDYKSLSPGEIPVYGTGGVMTYVNTAAHPGPSVLIPRKGSLSKLYYVDEPFWTVDTIFYTEIGERLHPKYFYYYLSTLHLENLNQAGGVPSLTQSVLNGLRIPVPPIEVQAAIARTLDEFTELNSELKAQLEAERKARHNQHSYYRELLFRFTADPAIRREPMGKIGNFVRGRRFTKADMQATGIPCIHYGEIYTHYGTAAFSTVSHVREDLAPQLRFARQGDVVLAAVGETVEDVGKAVAWLGDENVAIHDDCFVFRSPLNPRFVAHYLQTDMFNSQKARYVARAKVKRLSGEGLAKLQIPTPSMVEQERVVQILDNFEVLTQEFSAALLAELTDRQQQFDFYRDKVLTFQEIGA